MAKITNGSSILFGGNLVGSPTQVAYSDTAPAVTTTGWDAAFAGQEVGVPVHGLNMTFTGSAGNHNSGDTGTLSVSWTDGGSTSLGNAEIASVAIAGSMDAVISTTLTFVRNS